MFIGIEDQEVNDGDRALSTDYMYQDEHNAGHAPVQHFDTSMFNGVTRP